MSRIYIDLSEEFKKMDPATPEVSRRKILASHLKESIDVLEMKVRQGYLCCCISLH